MFKRFSKKQRIWLKLFFIAYCLMLFVLIVEAATPGQASSNQSDAIGGAIAGLVNNSAGDQAVLIEPKEVKIVNENDKLQVSSKMSLECEILPVDCSFTSLLYTSSDETVAEISSKGEITALKAGKVTITVAFTSFPEIQDSFILSVENVLEQTISVSLDSEYRDGIYYLEKDRGYPIVTEFNPENTTLKEVTYSATENACFHIRDDVLYADEISSTPLSLVVTSSQGKKDTLQFVIEPNSSGFIPLERIEAKAKGYVMSVEESIPLSKAVSLSFYPSNATYKNYSLISDDPDIIKVTGNQLLALSPGVTTITIFSSKQEDVQAKVEISADYIPLNSVELSLNQGADMRIKRGEQAKIALKNAHPKNATAIVGKHIECESSDESIIEVTKDGVLTAKSIGAAQITVSFFNGQSEEADLVKKLQVSVYEAVSGDFYDVEIADNLSENSEKDVIYNQKAYDLKERLALTALLDSNLTPIVDTDLDKTLIYTVEEIDERAEYSFENGVFESSSDFPFLVTFKVVHQASVLYKFFTKSVINEVKVSTSDEPLDTIAEDRVEFGSSSYPAIADSIPLLVNESTSLKVDDLSEQEYNFQVNESSFAEITYSSSKALTVRGVEEGELRVLITPSYNGNTYTSLSKVVVIQVSHIYNSTIDLKVYDEKEKTYLDLSKMVDDNGQLYLSLHPKAKYDFIINQNSPATKSEVTVKSDDERICEVDNEGHLVIHNIGNTDLVFEEHCVKIGDPLKRVCHIFIKNICELNEEKPFTLKQNKLKYSPEENLYQIENGTAAKLKTNFTKESTFKEVHYYSSDEEILLIGDDGNITPVKAGKVIITARINDSNSIDITYSINVEVVKKSVISNMQSFLLMIRKGIGHFGAFLVFALCSSFLFYSCVDEKYLLLAFALNTVHGFVIAEVTEVIQLFTPGRAGLFSDVIIDTLGFTCGAVLVLLFFLLTVLIKRLKKKKGVDNL